MRAVTPDTNLYVSALIWGGKLQALLEMALARKVRLFISDAIMDEMMEVLAEKFNHSPKRLALEKEYVQRCTVRCVPKIKLSVVKDDPDDNKILECAVHHEPNSGRSHRCRFWSAPTRAVGACLMSVFGNVTCNAEARAIRSPFQGL